MPVSSVQRARNGQAEGGDGRVEAFAIVGDHLVAALHAANPRGHLEFFVERLVQPTSAGPVL